MPPNTVKIDRSTVFGNPFSVELYGREGAVDRFRRWIFGEMSAREMSMYSGKLSLGVMSVSLAVQRNKVLDQVHRLQGKNLACWCRKGERCHGDVLLEFVAVFKCEKAA
jgi:hypothetical protein